MTVLILFVESDKTLEVAQVNPMSGVKPDSGTDSSMVDTSSDISPGKEGTKIQFKFNYVRVGVFFVKA